MAAFRLRKSMIFWAAFLSAAALAYCSREEFLAQDAASTKQAIIKKIPLGTPVEKAKDTMERHGFHCLGMPPDRAHNSPFLYCDSGERLTAGILISKRWQVGLLHENGTVSEIWANVGLTGP